MRNTKSAFTLVELIVVITILAILGTIAFISLQGYSADARNSKRTSDLGNIQSAMSLKMVEGVPAMSFVTHNDDNTIDSIQLAGLTDASSSYDAGTPAYTVLNVAEKDFKDPNDKAYRVGVTTKKASAFQLAATMEIDGVDTALVNGTYTQRETGKTFTGTIDGDTLSIIDAGANYFKVGDTVNLTGGAGQPGVEIIKVSRDGVTLTMDADIVANANTIAIAVDEEAGLIAATKDENGDAIDNQDTAVVNNKSDALAY